MSLAPSTPRPGSPHQRSAASGEVRATVAARVAARDEVVRTTGSPWTAAPTGWEPPCAAAAPGRVHATARDSEMAIRARRSIRAPRQQRHPCSFTDENAHNALQNLLGLSDIRPVRTKWLKRSKLKVGSPTCYFRPHGHRDLRVERPQAGLRRQAQALHLHRRARAAARVDP